MDSLWHRSARARPRMGDAVLSSLCIVRHWGPLADHVRPIRPVRLMPFPHCMMDPHAPFHQLSEQLPLSHLPRNGDFYSNGVPRNPPWMLISSLEAVLPLYFALGGPGESTRVPGSTVQTLARKGPRSSIVAELHRDCNGQFAAPSGVGHFRWGRFTFLQTSHVYG